MVFICNTKCAKICCHSIKQFEIEGNCKMIFREKKSCVIGLFLLIFLTSSFTVTCDAISSGATMLLWMILLIMSVFANRFLQKKVFAIYIVIVWLYIASTIVNKQDLVVQMKILFGITVAMIFVNAFDNKEIKNAFVNIIFGISVISTPLYFLSITVPSIFAFSYTPGTSGRAFYNLFFYGYMIGSNRNSGLFWEPGAYATFLNLGLFLMLNDNSLEIERKYTKLIVCLIALLTTFSTAGFGTFALVLIIYLANNEVSKRQKVFITICIVILIVLSLGYYYEEIFISGNGVFGKLKFYREHMNYYSSGETTSSTSVRIYSVLKPLEAFLENPIFGVGNSNLQSVTAAYTKGAITCTFVNWFASNGFLYGFLIILGYIKLINSSDKTRLVKILTIVFVLVAIAAEDYSQNPLFLGISIMGYKSRFYSDMGKEVK